MKTNTKSTQAPIYTHEGGKASHINAEQELRRSLFACMLWEDSFYESGISIGERILDLIPKIKPERVADLALIARTDMKLRHAPLLVARAMAALDTHKPFVASTLEHIIQRPDELAEFLSIYWAGQRTPIANQVKKGLARAFQKFGEYELAKYNWDKDIKLRDVLFMVHAKPKDKAQAKLWKKLVDGTLETPDTWEVELSQSKDKKESWTRLLKEKKLGALALLRNLRNMNEAGVSEKLVFGALDEMKVDRVLPFRFVSAARYAPQWEPQLEEAMFKAIEGRTKLPGKTVILVDVSSSMQAAISDKSDLRRWEAAAGLAILARELCEDAAVYTFNSSVQRIPARRGFALRDAISKNVGGGTELGRAITEINRTEYDRIIVLTDEQTADRVGKPKGQGYIINVAAYKNGVGYSDYVHIEGWSEAVFDYIQALEE